MSGAPDELRPLAANPGHGGTIRISLARGERKWEEQADLVALLVDVLEQGGYSATAHEGKWVDHAESGFRLLPQIASFHPLEKGGIRTVTTIQTHHSSLVPEGLFEYQHSSGDDTQTAIRKGFDQWVRTDFIPLLDATLPQGKLCTTMVMTLPEAEGRPERTRRAVLGPIAHYRSDPPASDPEEEHPFCPCCLVTRSFLAFKELFEADKFFGVRLFALRDAEGVPGADCRVNGEDYQAGADALKSYAEAWPAAGYEFRKQYVIFQTVENADEVTMAPE